MPSDIQNRLESRGTDIDRAQINAMSVDPESSLPQVAQNGIEDQRSRDAGFVPTREYLPSRYGIDNPPDADPRAYDRLIEYCTYLPYVGNVASLGQAISFAAQNKWSEAGLAATGIIGGKVVGELFEKGGKFIGKQIANSMAGGGVKAGTQIATQAIGETAVQGIKAASKEVTPLSQQAQRAISKIDNAIGDHVTPGDISGTVDDILGNPIPKSSGGFWNHLQEMTDTLRGLRKNEALLGGINNPAAQAAAERARAAIQQVTDAIKGLGL